MSSAFKHQLHEDFGRLNKSHYHAQRPKLCDIKRMIYHKCSGNVGEKWNRVGIRSQSESRLGYLRKCIRLCEACNSRLHDEFNTYRNSFTQKRVGGHHSALYSRIKLIVLRERLTFERGHKTINGHGWTKRHPSTILLTASSRVHGFFEAACCSPSPLFNVEKLADRLQSFVIFVNMKGFLNDRMGQGKKSL